MVWYHVCMKKKILWAIVIGVVLVVLVYTGYKKAYPLHTPNKNYKVIVSNTEAMRTKGLSGKTELQKNTVMLFVFEKPDYYGIWMKDMQFPIDIVYLNEQYEVISYYDHIVPETYPTIFYPEKLATYILEMNAGEREKSGLDKGVKVYYK